MVIAVPEIYAVPVLDKFLIYSPLQKISAFVNPSAAKALHKCLQSNFPPPEKIQGLVESLKTAPVLRPERLTGILKKPLFLGIIPTRACNLNCTYCDFNPEDRAEAPMSLAMARQTMDAYFDILDQRNGKRADIQFFGGEPFHASDVIYFSVAYGWRHAKLRSMDIHFEVTTNGMFSQRVAGWVADHFNAVILSLDGPADIQEYQRPARNRNPVFNTVFESAKVLSAGPSDLILRVCVSDKTVTRVPEIAKWMVEEFHPKAVCFETLHINSKSEAAQLGPPDSIQFACQFSKAAILLEAHGVMALHSSADLTNCHLSMCPVGKDALIVSPDGTVDACYLPEQVWQARDLDFRLGKIKDGSLVINQKAVKAVRAISAKKYTKCLTCFCQYHCAGGCHVRKNGVNNPSDGNGHCLQTRLITISNILRRMELAELASRWLDSQRGITEIAHMESDLLRDLV